MDAVYGRSTDWDPQALQAALEFTSEEYFDGTRESLVNWLIGSRRFTLLQAEFAANAAGYPDEELDSANQEPGESEMLTPAQLLGDALNRLNRDNSNGRWARDVFDDGSGLSIGILLDEYEQGGGCAMWWYETVVDADTAISQNQINFFSSFYKQWVFGNGASMVLVAEGGSQQCFLDAKNILGLPD